MKFHMKERCFNTQMKNTDDPAYCADKMKVLSDVTRLFVLEELLVGAKNVTELNARAFNGVLSAPVTCCSSDMPVSPLV